MDSGVIDAMDGVVDEIIELNQGERMRISRHINLISGIFLLYTTVFYV